MANYKILISESAEKALRNIPKGDVKKITAHIEALSINPYPQGVRKLSGYEDIYRIRVGNYRILYEIQNRELVIWVLKVGHRKDIYR